MPTRAKRRITAEDLYRIQLVSGPEISPDGRHVAFSLSRVARKTEEKYANLWVVPTDGGRERQFTYGDQSDTGPRWSPDGSQIAFLSDRGDLRQPQIYVIPFQGGEARLLSNLKGKFGSYEWSSDGRRPVCEFQKLDPDAIEREEDADKRRLGIVYRHITRVDYKRDGVGFLPKERWHTWTVNARDGGRHRSPMGRCTTNESLDGPPMAEPSCSFPTAPPTPISAHTRWTSGPSQPKAASFGGFPPSSAKRAFPACRQMANG